MRGTTRGRRVQLIALAAGLAVAACQTAPPSSGSPAAATPGPSTPEVTSGPSPSAAAVDVVPLFAAAMQGLSSGVVSMDGNATVGPIKVTISATSSFDGPDSKGRTTTTVGGNATTVETVKVAGKSYAKTGEGPWLEVATPPSKDFTTALKDASRSLTDKGTSTRAGKSVHELVASSGSAFDPSVFLASATGVSDVGGTTTFYCEDDGTPVGATIDVTWKQAVGGQTLDGTMTFEIDFSSLGSGQAISAPEGVWSRLSVEKRGYSIGHPSDYDYTAKQGFDYFFGPDESFYFASRADTQGFTLNLITRGEINSFKSTLKTKTVSNGDITVGGLPGRLISATGTNAQLGGKVVLYEAITVKGKFAYFIAWVSKVGNEAADLAMFRQVVATFQFLA